MMLIPQFVQRIPPGLPPKAILYVCLKDAEVAMQCPCGCGGRNDIQLDPDLWTVFTDGRHVTIAPSINVTTGCGSHYNITANEVVWAGGNVKGQA